MYIKCHIRSTVLNSVRVAAMLLLALMLVVFLVPAAAINAHAATSAEKQAEADELVRQLDALQTDIYNVTNRLNEATAAQNNALQQMADAKAREAAAIARTTELQKKLNERAVETYRNGSISYLDVLFGAKTFTDFLISWDMINRMNEYDAQLTRESKEAQREAEAAHQIYAEQERIAAGKKDEIAELKAQLEATSAAMAVEIERLNEEAAELLAQEEAAAEAARLAALAAEAAANGGGSGGGSAPEIIYGMGGIVHPCPGATITSRFGWRGFDNSFHKGIDLAAGTGTPIMAAYAGTVVIAGYDGGAGNWIMIMHGNGLVTKYMHGSQLYVSAGEYVYAGQVIMAMGSTGYSTGPHLHFQIEVNGVAQDPYYYLY